MLDKEMLHVSLSTTYIHHIPTVDNIEVARHIQSLNEEDMGFKFCRMFIMYSSVRQY